MLNTTKEKFDLSGNPIIHKDVTFYTLANGDKIVFKYK